MFLLLALDLVFVKALILNHFDLKYYIYIKTNIFSYTINRIFNQLTLDNLVQWYSAAFFSQKMIHIKICYKPYKY